MSPLNFQDAFTQLNQLLIEFQAVWRAKPFVQDTLPWQNQYPHLHNALLELNDEQLQSLEDETYLLDWMSAYLPQLGFIAQLQTPRFEGELIDMAKFADVGIGGRKKQQIVGFASVVKNFGADGGNILDWCSGKGHLAKHLNYVTGQPVTCLEYDKALCDAGAIDAAKLNYDIRFIEQDVLQSIDSTVVESANLNTALHACGALHISMLKTATKARSSHIALSPCCYHLIKHDHYEALSQRAKQSKLSLSKDDLRLAVLQTVTAGNRVKRLREQELVWRIGFDLLQRQLTGVEQYHVMASFNKQCLSGSFDDFCQFMAKQLRLKLPKSIDTNVLLHKARLKHQQILRLEKARLAFRKAMEYWLLLDRVLFLQEQGYEVDMLTFCDEKTSPRNALILGRRF
ncbi:MAG: SAM-dependent methyltransferase [Psychrosphaera sp.]|nr:SAM-dependent methyltransferase [Psychrosphaera sp.]